MDGDLILFDDRIEKDAASDETTFFTEKVRLKGQESNLTVTSNELLLTMKSKQTEGEQYKANIFAVYNNNKFLCVSGFMLGYGMFTSSMKRAEELRWMKQLRYAVVMSEFLLKKRILFQGELHYRLFGESDPKGASSRPSGWIRHEPADQNYRCVYAVPCEMMDKGNQVLINPFGSHFQLAVAMNCHWLIVLKGLSTFILGTKISAGIHRENPDSHASASNRDARNREIEILLLIDGEIVYLDTPEFIVRLQTGFVPVYGPNLDRVSKKAQENAVRALPSSYKSQQYDCLKGIIEDIEGIISMNRYILWFLLKIKMFYTT